MEEKLDIVDEQDDVVGKDTRKNIHQNHQIHRGIHVLVVNSKREILLQRRSEKKDYYPGFYDASVGAHIFSGESYQKAAFRETQEELGFRPMKLIKVCDYKSYSLRQRENRRLFKCHYNGPFKIDREEVDLVKFFSIKAVEKEIKKGKMKLTEGFKISFKKYIELCWVS